MVSIYITSNEQRHQLNTECDEGITAIVDYYRDGNIAMADILMKNFIFNETIPIDLCKALASKCNGESCLEILTKEVLKPFHTNCPIVGFTRVALNKLVIYYRSCLDIDRELEKELYQDIFNNLFENLNMIKSSYFEFSLAVLDFFAEVGLNFEIDFRPILYLYVCLSYNQNLLVSSYSLNKFSSCLMLYLKRHCLSVTTSMINFLIKNMNFRVSKSLSNVSCLYPCHLLLYFMKMGHMGLILEKINLIIFLLAPKSLYFYKCIKKLVKLQKRRGDNFNMVQIKDLVLSIHFHKIIQDRNITDDTIAAFRDLVQVLVSFENCLYHKMIFPDDNSSDRSTAIENFGNMHEISIEKRLLLCIGYAAAFPVSPISDFYSQFLVDIVNSMLELASTEYQIEAVLSLIEFARDSKGIEDLDIDEDILAIFAENCRSFNIAEERLIGCFGEEIVSIFF